MGQPDCFECKYGGLGHPCRSADGGFDVEAAAAAMLTRARLMAADEDPDPESIEAVDWIVDCEYELIEDHPGLIPPLIAAAINACETARDAAYLAAGLVETALVRQGPEIIASIEAMAVAHAKARYVLSGGVEPGGQRRCRCLATARPRCWRRSAYGRRCKNAGRQLAPQCAR
jgi:hypothetical protein